MGCSVPVTDSGLGEPRGELLPAGGDRAARGSVWWKVLAWVALAALFANWLSPILTLPKGFWLRGNSSLFDLYRSLGLLEAWECGIWDGRMLPTFRKGHGSPILGLYAPLYLWVNAGWIVLLGSWKAGMTLGVATWLAAGCGGAFLAARRVWRGVTGSADAAFWAGAVATVGWLVSAYPITDLYVRSDGPEFAAVCLVPGLFWAVWRALGPDAPAGRKCAGRVAWLAVILAAMVMSHNFYAMVALGLVVVLPAGVWLTPQRQGDGGWRMARPRNVAWYVVAVGLGLGLAAIFWVPALVEMRYTQVYGLFSEQGVQDGEYLSAKSLLAVDEWRRPPSRPGSVTARHLGWIILPAAWSVVTAVAALVWTKRPGVRAVGVMALALAVATIAGMWFVTPSSAVFWERVPMGRVVQFPWRILAVPTVGVCLVLPAALMLWWAGQPGELRVRRRGAWAVGLVLAALLVFAVQRSTQRYMESKKMPMPDPQTLWSDSITTAVLDEYATVWQQRGEAPAVAAGTVTPGPHLRIVRQEGKYNPLRITVANEAQEQGSIEVAYTYFPGWAAVLESAGTAGESELEVGPAPGGAIRIGAIPPGEQTILLGFENTPVRLACKGVSLVSLFAVAGLVAAGWHAQRAAAGEKMGASPGSA